MTDLSERKLELIKEVSEIRDEKDLSQLEETLRVIHERQERIQKFSKPIHKKTDPDAIKRQRNFKGHDKEEMFRLIREIDVQEPIEELLAMLTK